MSQQGLTAGDSWASATSLDRFVSPTITRPLVSPVRCRTGDRVQLQVEYFSPSVQCHCTWHVQHLNDTAEQPVQDGTIVNTNYSSTLTIDSVTSELQGLYTFVVENVYGSATTKTRLIVNEDHIDDEQHDSRISFDYQEVLDEPPIKKKHLGDDKQHLHILTPHEQRMSIMHHMPLHESIEYEEDVKIHIPGGGAGEEIIIHTDFAPQTPRLSINEQQPQQTLLPVNNILVFFS